MPTQIIERGRCTTAPPPAPRRRAPPGPGCGIAVRFFFLGAKDEHYWLGPKVTRTHCSWSQSRDADFVDSDGGGC
jgi:hypothetical protein